MTTPAGPPGAPAPPLGDPQVAPAAPRRGGMADAVLSSGLTLVVGLLSAVVVSRIYGVVVVGEYALVAAPFALISYFSNVNEHQALVRALSTEAPSSVRAGSLFVVQTVFSTLLTALMVAVLLPLAVLLLRATGHPNLVGPAVALVLAYLVLGKVAWNCDTFQVAFRGTRALLVSRLVDVVLLLFATVALVPVVGASTSTLVLAQVLTMAAALLLRLVLLHRVLTGRPTRQGVRDGAVEMRAFVRFGIRLVPGAAAQVVTAQAGTWIIGAVRPLAVLGAYSRANNLANRIVEIGYRLGEVLLPALSADVHQGRPGDAVARFARWRLLVLLPLTGLAAALSGAAVGLLAIFGPGFSEAAVPLGLLVFAYGAGVLSLMHTQFLVALDAPSTVSRLNLLRAAVSLSLIGPLTLRFGAAGAAAALLLGFVVELVLAVRALGRQLAGHGVHDETVPWLRLAAATTCTLVVARLVDTGLRGVLDGVPADVAAGLAGGVAGLAVHVVLLPALGLLPADVRAGLLRRVRRRG